MSLLATKHPVAGTMLLATKHPLAGTMLLASELRVDRASI